MGNARLPPRRQDLHTKPALAPKGQLPWLMMRWLLDVLFGRTGQLSIVLEVLTTRLPSVKY